MASAARSTSLASPVLVEDRRSSPWTRTVAVIRIPRFTLFESIRRKSTRPDDPLAAFATETELEATRRL